MIYQCASWWWRGLMQADSSFQWPRSKVNHKIHWKIVPFSLKNVTTVINTSRRSITIEEGESPHPNRLHNLVSTCTNYLASRAHLPFQVVFDGHHDLTSTHFDTSNCIEVVSFSNRIEVTSKSPRFDGNTSRETARFCQNPRLGAGSRTFWPQNGHENSA